MPTQAEIVPSSGAEDSMFETLNKLYIKIVIPIK